jgi:prepilin-type N-terminal cleavage/methylation domain-containing protein
MTLLELIVVIVILGILAAIAIPTFQSIITKSHNAAVEQTASAIDHDALALAAFTNSSISSSNVQTAVGELHGYSWVAGPGDSGLGAGTVEPSAGKLGSYNVTDSAGVTVCYTPTASAGVSAHLDSVSADAGNPGTIVDGPCASAPVLAAECTGPYATSVMSFSPVDYWPLGESSGATTATNCANAPNTVSYSTPGTFNGNPVPPLVPGNAGVGSGAGSYAALSPTNSGPGGIAGAQTTTMGTEGTQTISEWVNLNGTEMYGYLEQDPTSTFELAVAAATTFAEVQVVTGDEACQAFSTGGVGTGWENLTAEFDATAGTCTMYINGVPGAPTSEVPRSGSLTSPPGTYFGLTGSSGPTAEIAHVAVFNQVLSAGDVATLATP